MKKVFIIGGGGSYHNMFEELGFMVVDSLEQSDLVCFTGGEDVNPALYDHPKHPTTGFSTYRDAKEAVLFERCKELSIPMVGICRGGQLLNVMSGGTMYQDVTAHTYDHILIDNETGETVWVTSTHHQMMCPSKDAIIIAHAEVGGYRTVWNEVEFISEKSEMDYEVLFYPENKALCFQPHPEYGGYPVMRQYFAGLLNKHLGV